MCAFGCISVVAESETRSRCGSLGCPRSGKSAAFRGQECPRHSKIAFSTLNRTRPRPKVIRSVDIKRYNRTWTTAQRGDSVLFTKFLEI